MNGFKRSSASRVQVAARLFSFVDSVLEERLSGMLHIDAQLDTSHRLEGKAASLYNHRLELE